MDTGGIIKQLTEERDRIDEVIRVLSGSDAKAIPPQTAKTGRKPMSDAARKRRGSFYALDSIKNLQRNCTRLWRFSASRMCSLAR
jgi:hypothetical protein